MLAPLTASILLALAAPQQDELELTNGRVLKVRSIESETFEEVVYRTASGGNGRKDSSEVLEVRHDLSPRMLDDYAKAMEELDAGNFAQAAAILRTVLGDERLMERTRYAWVKQHALYRLARAQFAMADAEAVKATVDRLLQQVPDTFFYAPALMLKAEALTVAGQDGEARSVYQRLADDVASKGLPERWAREAELGLAILDRSDDAKARERRMAGLAEKNADRFPTVASRANVQVGNIMVESGDYDKAQLFFERIVKSGQADESTMAEAWSGLGDCYYYRGIALETEGADGHKEQFRRAALNHLRVITLYKDAVRLVPRSHYHAAQALRRMNDADTAPQATQLAARLKRLYPQSKWWTDLKREWNLR